MSIFGTAGLNFFGSDADAEKKLSRAEKIHRDNERSNLLTISRLVLRSFLEQAMVSRNRIIDCESQQLSDLLMMLEKVFFHGFRAINNRSFLAMKTPDSELWSALSLLSRGEESMVDAICCINRLEELITPISKIRAFLRIAMMQKKIAEFFSHISSSQKIREYYESWSLMRHEDLVQLSGSLLGLSVIDCNIQLDYINLQEQPLSIDFSQYIKIPTLQVDCETVENLSPNEDELKAALDQSSFLDERNRFLQSQLNDLKKKLEDYEKSQSNLIVMDDMVKFRNIPDEEKEEKDDSSCKNEFQELQAENKELTAQLCEKEDSIQIYAQQLEDTKRINVDLYEKLRLSEEIVRKLENDFLRLKDKNNQEKDILTKSLRKVEQHNNSLMEKVTVRESDQDTIRSELEKKCEQYSDVLSKLEEKQLSLVKAEEKITENEKELTKLRESLKELPSLLEELENLRDDYPLMKARASELEKALEEMGGQLSESKLRIIELAEEFLPLSDAQWAKDSEVTSCTSCDDKFTLAKRKHHCRMCGSIFCANCSTARVKLPSNPKPVRVCETCFSLLQNRQP